MSSRSTPSITYDNNWEQILCKTTRDVDKLLNFQQKKDTLNQKDVDYMIYKFVGHDLMSYIRITWQKCKCDFQGDIYELELLKCSW